MLSSEFSPHCTHSCAGCLGREGMDIHEWGNGVKNNKRLIEPGVCFSIEPTIAIPGEFDVRLEDCVFMAEDGPNWFSQPSKSITEPFAS